MSKQKRYSPEVRERAVRMLLEHEREYESRWAAMQSIADKIGCTAETLRGWVKQEDVPWREHCESRGLPWGESIVDFC